MHADDTQLPLILAGPILRRVTPKGFALWLVASQRLECRLSIGLGQAVLYAGEPEAAQGGPGLTVVQVGESAFVHLLDLRLDLPPDRLISYRLEVRHQADWQDIVAVVPELGYGQVPRIPVASRLREVLHGSCRKPHYPAPDALVAADAMLAQRYVSGDAPPDLLVMSGDQVYIDDLCGPMLLAVHQVIRLLGLPDESFTDAPLPDSQSLYAAPGTPYGRREYLPRLLAVNRLSRFFGQKASPVFTSGYCDNHLISFAETFALYLLSWSPALWALIDLPEAAELPLVEAKQALYAREMAAMRDFIKGLPQVRRLMAHLPTYMIFDDHDVTDDWNLTAGWEQAAYGHPFSRRIIGNALMSYWLCQGWGNDPRAFPAPFWEKVFAWSRQRDTASHQAWIEELLRFEGWQYHLETSPKLVVLDTRTRRWHSESSEHKPSGLMNWEALSEMQQCLMHEAAVVLVSPAPIFGLKLVEVLQKLLTFCGQALAVDAENWMAHPGAASTLLNIFRHARTPKHVVILSGDVHYSFAYDIVIRFRRNSPKIWQITASGLKNQFPDKILRRLGKLNRVLYHRASPLNWFTRRKRMKIEPRLAGGKRGRQLVNASAIGLVRFNPDGAPSRIGLLTATGEQIDFIPDEDSPIGYVAPVAD